MEPEAEKTETDNMLSDQQLEKVLTHLQANNRRKFKPDTALLVIINMLLAFVLYFAKLSFEEIKTDLVNLRTEQKQEIEKRIEQDSKTAIILERLSVKMENLENAASK